MIFSTHALISAMQSQLSPRDLDPCLSEIMEVVIFSSNSFLIYSLSECLFVCTKANSYIRLPSDHC